MFFQVAHSRTSDSEIWSELVRQEAQPARDFYKGFEAGDTSCRQLDSRAHTFGIVIMFEWSSQKTQLKTSRCSAQRELSSVFLTFSSFHSVELIEPFAWNKDVLLFELLVSRGGKAEVSACSRSHFHTENFGVVRMMASGEAETTDKVSTNERNTEDKSRRNYSESSSGVFSETCSCLVKM